MATLKKADSLFQCGRYNAAAAAYQELLQQGEVLTGRLAEVEYRLCVALGRGEQWDEALEAALAFLQRHSGTEWEVRILVWLAELYRMLPGEAYRVTDRAGRSRVRRGYGERGFGVPLNEDGSSPEPIHCQSQDDWIADAALEAARVRCSELKGGAGTAEIGLCFALVQVLWKRMQEQGGLDDWQSERDPAIDPDGGYDPEWPLPRKILSLFARIRKVAAPLPDGVLFAAASLLGEAVWLFQYQCSLEQEEAEEETGPGPARYLYGDENPEERIDAVLALCTEGLLREQALLTRALFRADRGSLEAAVTDLRGLSRGAAEGEIRKQATRHLQTITRRELSLKTAGAQLPGRPAQVTLTYRNVTRVHYTVYPFDLRAAYAADPVQSPSYHSRFPGTELTLGEVERFYGAPIAQGWLDLPPGEPYCFRTETISLPVEEAGAYAVAFRTAGARVTGLVLITGVALVYLRTPAAGLFFLADAASGAARGGGELRLRDFDHEHGLEQVRAEIGADGSLRLPTPEVRSWNRHTYRALAVRGAELALSGEVYTPWAGARVDDRFQVHAVMDRPVYRPGQTARFRLLLMQREGGWWKPVPDREITFRVVDSGHTPVEELRLRTDAWGAASGELLLPPDAALGLYQGRVIGMERGGVQDCSFRVEEYRKPEFSVSVTPEPAAVRPGQPAVVTVRGTYYWGAPVADAVVTYRIFRQAWRPASPFFIGWVQEVEDAWYSTGETLVETGEVRTAEDGSAEVRFNTRAESAGNPGAEYRVEVELRDASRRVITGTARVRASRRSRYVFARAARSYVAPGAPVDVEIQVQDGEGRPVQASGSVRVYRQSPPAPKETQPQEERVHESVLETDGEGAAVIRWAAGSGGSYRVAFDVWDPEAGKEVGGSAEVWVRGVSGTVAARGRLALRPELPSYREGETARILITAPREGCTVLLLRVEDREVREHQWVAAPAGECEIEVALGAAEVPNVRLQAVSICDGESYQAACDFSVRPAVEALRIDVAAERESCRPGETARLRILARNAAGSPVRAKLSLSVYDAALAYIQQDLTRPIHAAFTPPRRDHSVNVAASPALCFSGASMLEEAPRADGLVPFPPAPALSALPGWEGQDEDVWYSLYVHYRFSPDEARSHYYPFRMSKRLRRTGEAVFGMLAGAPAAGAAAEDADLAGASLEISSMICCYGPEDSPSPVEAPVRQEFADTAFWSAAVHTDAAGEAVVEFACPENLTEWRAFAAGNTQSGEVGEGETHLRTAQEVVVRPQTPRFLVEGDEAVLSAVVHNYGEAPLHGTAWLEAEGDALELCPGGALRAACSVAAGGEARIDWRVQARRPGVPRVRMGFTADGGGDAAEVALPVLVRGARVSVVQAGELREGGAIHARDRLTLRLPEARRPGTARLVVRAAPSLVGLVLDALPYLIDYPYGCVEQTVSRFVPAVLAGRALQRLGIDLERFHTLREEGRAAERALRPPAAVEHSPYTYPELGRSDLPARLGSPALTNSALQQVVERSLNRLRRARNGDGGWGWWPGYRSAVEMTAYVADSLREARAAGWTLPAGLLEDSLRYLARHLQQDLEQESRRRWMDRHTRVQAASVLAPELKHQEIAGRALRERAYPERERLTSHGRALLAAALHEVGAADEARQVLENLLDRVRTDPHAGTAWWSDPTPRWYGYGSRAETSAAAVRAMLRILPASPVLPMVVRWLAQNRRGMAWYSTRETARVIRALLEYAEARGELAPDYTLALSLPGGERAEFAVRGAEAVLSPVVWEVPDERLPTGEQELLLEKQGKGALYYSATLEYFSAEDRIPETGHGLQIRRHYYRKRVVPHAEFSGEGGRTAHPEQWDDFPNPFLTGDLSLLVPRAETEEPEEEPAVRWERVPLLEGEPIRSGELLEVELTLEAENEIGYLLLEEIKPAGCEAEDRQSGPQWLDGLSVYRELRDQKVALFLERLPQGRTTLTYLLRAEAPGLFTALPPFGYAMYAPELQALGPERRVEVVHGS